MDYIINPIEWCLEQHKKTNHFYDKYLPYEFHLRMAVNIFKKFEYLLPKDDNFRTQCFYATYGHDLIEDTRTSYNDVKKILGTKAADIIYAVTNEKGKTRKERANNKYYEGILNIPGALFVKLCDRIANVEYSKMVQSSMFNMYKTEHKDFLYSLQCMNNHQIDIIHPYYDMLLYLDSLFK